MAKSKQRSPTRGKKNRSIPMHVDALREHAVEVLTEIAGGDTSRFLHALGYLSAMVRDRELPVEARSHVLYFATAYIGAVQGGRDSDETEAAEVNALDDEEIAAFSEYVSGHPAYAALVELVRSSTPDRIDMIYGFILTTVGLIFDADGVLRDEESAFFQQILRNPDLTERGLVSDGELTPKFEDVRRAAMTRLGPMLTPDDKVTIVDTLVRACACDGDIDPREIETMVKAMEMLDLPRAETFQILKALDDQQRAASPRRRRR